MRRQRTIIAIGLLGTATALLIVGCSSGLAPQKGAQEAACDQTLREAASYVGALRGQGKLPGFQLGDHGSLTSISEPVWDDDVGISYPVSIWFRGEREDDVSSYYYLVLKQNKQATWRLLEATRREKNSGVTERLLPK